MTGIPRDGEDSRPESLAAIQFAGPGEMRARCRAHDWSVTKLGPVEDWPQSLRATAATVLAAGFPSVIRWGPDLLQIYNDAYIPFLGAKHPMALGISARECWPEAATVNEPIYTRVFAGETVTLTDELYLLHRHGPDALPDEVYISPSFSPVLDDGGGIAGVFVALFDTTAQVRARELQASLVTERARLEDIFRQAPVAIAVLRGRNARELVYELANPSYAAIIPSGRDIVGRPLGDVIPELADALLDVMQAVLDTGQPFVATGYRVPLDRDGDGRPEDYHFNFVYNPLVGPDGSVVGLISIGTEVSDLVRATDDATEQRDRFRSFVLQMPAAVAFHSGPAHTFEIVNAAFHEYAADGRTPVGSTPSDAFPDLRGQGVFERLDEVFRTGVAWASRETPIRFDRHGRGIEDTWFDLRYEPVRDASGAVIGILNYSTEVTAQVRARREGERLLAASEQAHGLAEAARSRTVHLYALAAALSMATTMPDVATAVVTHSADVFGAVGVVIARLNAAGDGLEIMQVEGMPNETRDAWQHIAASERVPLADVVRTGDAMFLESPGEWAARYPRLVPLLAITGHAANAVAPLIVDGRILGALGVAFDRPHPFDADERSLVLAVAAQCAQALERARLHEAERDARRDAEAANRGKSEFLAIMSHELRTPLNAIDGYAELMELGIRGPITDQQRQDLARIRRSQRHLLGLVNGLLNYSRAGAGALHYEMEDVQLDEILATCEALIAPQVRAKALMLVNQGCDPLVAARADREKLRQVILNLLTNAMKFTDPGGRIDLGCHRAGHDVCVTVADTGRGIPVEQIARVFEPFVQLDASLTRTQQGVGLGLAMSRDLARGMGGELTVESGVGVGSVFTLTLRSV
jgi:signal transduction histidine kinase/PAS domain-containing protein